MADNTGKKAARSGDPAVRAAARRAELARTRQLEEQAAVPIDQVVERAEAEAQAEFEGIALPAQVDLCGRRFPLRPKIARMPLLKFARAAVSGQDSSELDAMAAMYDVLRHCIDGGTPACGVCEACTGTGAEGEDGWRPPRPDRCPDYTASAWPDFEAWATECDADDSDLFMVVQQALEATASRPTSRSSGSSTPGHGSTVRSPGRAHPQAAGL